MYVQNDYNDAFLSADEKNAVAGFSKQYNAAKAAGDTAGMNAAHAGAEAIRSKYGYSGGQDGSQYIVNNSVTLPSATDQSDKLTSLYGTRQDAALAALERQYNQSLAELDREAQGIPQYYYEAKNQTAGTAALEKQAMNERFAASGLNTGAAGQAAIAQSNALQGNLSALNQAEADALKEVEAQRAQLTLDYQNAIKEAILNNELEKAQALYDEAVRVDESTVSTALQQAGLNLQAQQQDRSMMQERAELLASLGDFSGYAALGYTEQQLAAMQAAYAAATAGGGGGGRSSAYSSVLASARSKPTPARQQAYLELMADAGYITPEEALQIYMAELGNGTAFNRPQVTTDTRRSQMTR